jgi:CelD/BcsL family acetyltransferase involved in cellulose biosynthesis
MMSQDGAVSFLGGTDLVDYHDFLAPDGARPQDIEAIVRELGREPGCSCMELLSIADGSPALGPFISAAKAAGWQVEVAQEDVAPRMDLPSTWDEYLEGLDKKERHELRRKMRRIEGAGELKDVELTAPAEVGAEIGDFFTLHRMSRPDKAEFMTPAREQFFRAVSVALAEEGRTRLRFLEIDGERVATSLSFVVGATRYLYNSGYNPARGDLSVGLMNHAFAIKSSIAEGLKVFDFMRGNEPYKYRLGGKDRAIYRIIARR